MKKIIVVIVFCILASFGYKYSIAKNTTIAHSSVLMQENFNDLIGKKFARYAGVQTDDNYDRIYSLLSSYFAMDYNRIINYPPKADFEQEFIINFIGQGLHSGNIISPWNMETYYDNASGFYAIPKDKFSYILQKYFYEPVLDEDYLMEKSILLPNKSHYYFSLKGMYGSPDLDILNIQVLSDSEINILLKSPATQNIIDVELLKKEGYFQIKKIDVR